MDFYANREIASLILIIPDNPSGYFIPKAEVLALAQWAKHKDIVLVLDESFIDFADDDNSLLCQEILDVFRNLIIVKSISKSYGVAGLRLGIVASSNLELIGKLKKSVSIWNINSFAEFYLQIEEKYQKDYRVVLDKIREVRKEFMARLSEILFLRVIPSQTNFVCYEVLGDYTAAKLCAKLLDKEIFIKDLLTKNGFSGE